MTKSQKACLSYIIGLLLLIIIIYYVYKNDQFLLIISRITLFDFFISIVFVLAIFFINGCMLNVLLRRQFNTRLTYTDTALLPIMQRLFGYILPFRGGIAFSSLFLKTKYGLTFAKSLSAGLFTFIFLLQISGVIGLYYSYLKIFSVQMTISILLVCFPLFLFIASHILTLFKNHNHNLIEKIVSITINLIDNQKIFYSDYKLSFIFLSLNLLNIFFYVCWFYWTCNNILAVHFDITSIIMTVMIMKLSIVIRLTPGNLGVQEFVTGGTFYFLDGTIAEGFIIALLFRITVLILVSTLGVSGLIYNSKYFKLSEFKKVWDTLNK